MIINESHVEEAASEWFKELGYIYADGNVAYTSGNKGAQCISCHSQTGQIDYMLMNKYFP